MTPAREAFLCACLLLGSPLRAQQAAPSASPWARTLSTLPPLPGLDLSRGPAREAFLRVLARLDVEPQKYPGNDSSERLRRAAVRRLLAVWARARDGEKSPELDAEASDFLAIAPFLPAWSLAAAQEANDALHGIRAGDADWREDARRLFLSSPDPEQRRSLLRLIAGRSGFKSSLELLRWLYPDFSREIASLHPGLKHETPSGEAFSEGPFADPELAAAWAKGGLAVQADMKGLPFAFPAAVRPTSRGRRAMATLLPGAEAPSPAAPVVLTAELRSWRSHGSLKERYALFDEIIDANFRVLRSLSEPASEMTRSWAGRVLEETGRMADLFARLKPDGERETQRDYSLLAETLRRDLEGLGAEERLPGKALRTILNIVPDAPSQSLHSLVNWMHQQAILVLKPGYAKDGDLTGWLRLPAKRTPFIYLGDAPAREALARSPDLRAILEASGSIDNSGNCALLFSEDRVWMHSSLGYHSAEIFCDLSGPDEGGMLRVRYMESKEDGRFLRMETIRSFLEAVGVPCEIEGSRLLSIRWDKDHGLPSRRELVSAYPILLKFLHALSDLDLMFGHLRWTIGHQAAGDLARRLGRIYAAEGGWPFPIDDQFTIEASLKAYDDLEPSRKALAAKLGRELSLLGLPPIPEAVLMGKRTVEDYYDRPLEEAAARGEIRLGGLFSPARLDYSPLDDLARAASHDEEASLSKAAILAGLDEGTLAFEPIGRVGSFQAERALLRMSNGAILTFHILRDPASGRPAYARASIWYESRRSRGFFLDAFSNPSGADELSAESLASLLEREGFAVTAPEPLTHAQKRHLKGLLFEKFETRPGVLAEAPGLPASPGTASGPVSFDKSGRLEGAVLAVPYTTPDDLEAIARCAGVLATGGGSLSHAAITTRELKVPSVILAGARLAGGSLELPLAEPGPRKAAGGIPIQGLKRIEGARLREGDLVRIDGKTGEIFLLERSGDGPLHQAHAALERLRSGGSLEGRPKEAEAFLLEEALGNPRYAAQRPAILKALGREAPPARNPAPLPAPRREARSLPGTPSLLPLKDVDGGLTALVGGKSAKLGEMIQALKGLDADIPDGIALTYFAYERFLEENGLKDRVSALAARIDAGGDPGLSDEIRGVLLSGKLSPDKGVGLEIMEALKPLQGRLAVRSSAIQEDGDDAAFAGAAESYLNAAPGEVLGKVVENWASFWLPRGVLYRRSRGLKSADLQPATLIQEMAPADVSGVIFTRHPVDGADEAVINAAYGLGEGVVSGAVTPDSYAADKTTGEETRLPRISRKPWRIGAGGMETVPKELRGRRALGPGQVRDLALTAAAVERRFGRPMDVEFSISNGRIVILQARPITTR